MGLRAAFQAFFFFVLAFSTIPLKAEIKVASFSTVLSEITQKVGGKNVTVTSLIKPGQDPHEYQLTPGDLAAATAADLVLLSGKGMEASYLNNLRDALPKRVEVLAVGDQLPGLGKGAGGEKGGSAEATEDPHWWNSVSEVEKATAHGRLPSRGSSFSIRAEGARFVGKTQDCGAATGPARASDFSRRISIFCQGVRVSNRLD
jgi:ABC-type Zn uptake system ZnuABC Zn-binding protein ZnuA